MKPVGILIERVRDMDTLYGKMVRPLRQRIVLSTIDHEDNAIALLAMARELNVSFNELCAYIWLQIYVTEPEAYDAEYVAMLFGINLEKLEEYLHDRAQQIRAEDAQEELEEYMTAFTDQEIAARGFTTSGWNSYLEDLQRDAIPV